jgi:membrane associated rhomboid family serine protease
MKTFTDEIKYSFLPRFGALAEIIILNVGLYVVLGLVGLMFFLAGSYGIFEGFVRQYLSLPSNLGLLLFRPWTIITYGFLHFPEAVFHIAFNMLWMFWIGRILAEYISERNKHIWSLYLWGVLAGAVAYLLATNLFPIFRGTNFFLNGASAGVTAIIVGTATLVPNATIYLLFFGAVRLKWLALVFVLLDVLMLPAGNPGGRIAHLGGALIGFLYVSQMQKGNDWGFLYDKIQTLFRPKPKPRMRVVSSRVSSPSQPTGKAYPSSPQPAGKPSQQEIDRILDKIQAVGYENLTTEEKQTLYNAGKE